MANPEHVKKLKEGAGAWNAWRASSDEKPDLSGIELYKVSLEGHSLDTADFSGARLTSVSFLYVSGIECSFKSARIVQSRFRGANLRQCDFSEASIALTVFDQCFLGESNFEGAMIIGNMFASSSLRDARGLEAPYRSANNSIGIDTFFDSGGLPESFLRGARVPEEFIQYASSLTGTAIEYYSCFLSYTSKDEDFARRLYNDLQGRNIRTWFAPEDLKIGDRFRSRIDESIRVHDKLVLILSANSVASDWVETEVESALERERKEGRGDVLFPIAIDDEGFESEQPWAADIHRKRHIGDFRTDYTKAFDRLVRDLKKSQPPIIMKG